MKTISAIFIYVNSYAVAEERSDPYRATLYLFFDGFAAKKKRYKGISLRLSTLLLAAADTVAIGSNDAERHVHAQGQDREGHIQQQRRCW